MIYGAYKVMRIIRRIASLTVVMISLFALNGSTALAASPTLVYRLYNPLIKQHLQTIDANENSALMSRGWTSESSTFQALSAAGGSCGSGTEAVYRMFNSSDNDHMLTPDLNEATVIAANRDWHNEGIAFCAYATQVTGTKPVYRLFGGNGGSQEHFLTGDANEASFLGSHGWATEANGITFYAN
jgi:hypothetical protein